MNACFLLGSSEIPRFEHALDPDEDEKPKCLKPTILPDIVNKAKENVRNVVANQKKGTFKLIDVLNNSFDKLYLTVATRPLHEFSANDISRSS